MRTYRTCIITSLFTYLDKMCTYHIAATVTYSYLHIFLYQYNLLHHFRHCPNSCFEIPTDFCSNLHMDALMIYMNCVYYPTKVSVMHDELVFMDAYGLIFTLPKRTSCIENTWLYFVLKVPLTRLNQWAPFYDLGSTNPKLAHHTPHTCHMLAQECWISGFFSLLITWAEWHHITSYANPSSLPLHP